MKNHLYTTGIIALALSMSGLPAAFAHAEDSDSSAGAGTAVFSATIPGDNLDITASTSLEGRAAASSSERGMRRFFRGRDEQASSSDHRRGEGIRGVRGDANASSSDDGRGNATSSAAHKRNALRFEAHLDELEAHFTALLGASSTPVANLEELRARIDAREHALADFAASSSSTDRAVIDTGIRVSLAAHALIIARDLLGASSTVGAQVSQIATELNDSIASTTAAQAQIASRGFFTRLFFGGDAKAAAVLKDAASRNEDRIRAITDLLNEASASPEVKATLAARLQAAEDAQAQIASEAKAQANLWGLFSWRLF